MPVITMPARLKPQLASDDCLVFYNLRRCSIIEVIKAAEIMNDIRVLRHALTCNECREHIQNRELSSSESEMDMLLRSAIARVGERQNKQNNRSKF